MKITTARAQFVVLGFTCVDLRGGETFYNNVVADSIIIISRLAQPPRVRQRFVIKPRTSHVVCMQSIPGKVEESNEFVDSALLSQETEWMETSFTSSPAARRSSYLGPRVSFKGGVAAAAGGGAAAAGGGGRDRPYSAPNKERRDLMASTPNLSSASDPGPLNPELFASYSPGTMIS